MNSILIKDTITLLSIDQVRGTIRKRQAFGPVLLVAAIGDLVMQNKLAIDNGKIITLSDESKDEVLNEVLRRLLKHSGKKLSWFLNAQKDKLGAITRKQIKHMETTGMLDITPVSFFGVKTGNRYRIIKPGQLNPIIRSCDRVLLYGRSPGVRLAMMIPLIRIMGLVKVYYPNKEYRNRAQDRAREILKSRAGDNTGGMGLAIKLLSNILAESGPATWAE
jgi:hypothetical protein